MPFETFDLGRVLGTAEQIKGMREQGVLDRLRQQYVGEQIRGAQQAQDLAVKADARAETQSQQQTQQFNDEQKLKNLQLLNVAATDIAADPSRLSQWMPTLRGAGVLDPAFDPTQHTPEELRQMAGEIATRGKAIQDAFIKANPRMAEIAAQHNNTLAEIQARIRGEQGLAAQQNQYNLGQIQARGEQDLALEKAKGPGREQRTSQTLRKEYEGLDTVKNYKAVLPQINSAKKAPDTGAGDLDIIYAVGKIMDPGSVVREGELKLVIDASSPVAKLVGATRFNLGNGGRIPPKQRQQLITMLNGRVAAMREQYDRETQRFSQYAQEAGLDPTQVVGQPMGQSPSGQTPKRVKVDAQGNVIGN